MFGNEMILQQPLRESSQSEKNRSKTLLTGLEELLTLRQVFIRRTADPLNDSSQTSKNSYYSIVNDTTEQIFYAIQRNYICSRNWCKDLRKFEMSICNTTTGRQVLTLSRPFRFDCCFCCCFNQKLEVLAFPGLMIIGTIQQEWSICRPYFTVRLANGETLFHVLGPCCTMRCCVRELNFLVYTNEFINVAFISRQWTGLLRDDTEDAEFFGIEFNQDLDTRMKALILSACFLVNVLYYQE